MIRELDRATNRLAFSIVVTGIVVGSSILLHAKIQPFMSSLPGWLGGMFFAALHAGDLRARPGRVPLRRDSRHAAGGRDLAQRKTLNELRSAD